MTKNKRFSDNFQSDRGKLKKMTKKMNHSFAIKWTQNTSNKYEKQTAHKISIDIFLLKIKFS